MVNRPATLDTIVATDLHADILSDLAAALAGSLGIAPTGNIDPERRYPSMFEPIHGSAFDIMGKGLANPVGTFWSVVMLREHLGEADARAQERGPERALFDALLDAWSRRRSKGKNVDRSRAAKIVATPGKASKPCVRGPRPHMGDSTGCHGRIR
jgi:isocitrate/isopropylmalate dehydrogenase